MLKDQLDYANYVTNNALEGHRDEIEAARTDYNLWITAWLVGQIVVGLYLNSLVDAHNEEDDDYFKK